MDTVVGAQTLLDTVWREPTGELRLPVDPFSIAKDLGVQVYTETGLGDITEMIAQRSGCDTEIYLNAGDSRHRQRFSCARALAHLYRMSDARRDEWGYIQRREALSQPSDHWQTDFANRFAGELLMPAEVLTRIDTSDLFLAIITFGLPADIIQFRLEVYAAQYATS